MPSFLLYFESSESKVDVVVYNDQILAVYFEISRQSLHRPPAAVHKGHRFGQHNGLVSDSAGAAAHLKFGFCDAYALVTINCYLSVPEPIKQQTA
jgi:hypothetical protein